MHERPADGSATPTRGGAENTYDFGSINSPGASARHSTVHLLRVPGSCAMPGADLLELRTLRSHGSERPGLLEDSFGRGVVECARVEGRSINRRSSVMPSSTRDVELTAMGPTWRIHRSTGALLALLVLTIASTTHAQTVHEATAAGPAGDARDGILAAVDAFRAELGNPNNGVVVGSQGGGRREINWDGVPDGDSAPGRFPGDFFNAVSPRGAITSGDARLTFQVSADSDNPAAAPVEFGNLNPTYPTAFSAFSQQRLFAGLGFTEMDVVFVEAGTLNPAVVSGFGAVFTDVDTAGSSRIEFFDADGTLLFSRDVLATAGDESLSFLGVTFDEPVVNRVRITSGSAPMGPDDITQGGMEDIVVLDDFIYGEPIPIPDTDGDGSLDPFDGCANDAAKTNPGACGCGESDADSDGDGVPDCFDVCPNEDDEADADDDGVPDCLDVCVDADDRADADDDGVPDCFDDCPGCDDAADVDGDGTCDLLDRCTGDDATGDCDEDGVCDSDDVCAGGDDAADADGDGTPDFCEMPTPAPSPPADDDGAAFCGAGLASAMPAMLLGCAWMGARSRSRRA